MFKVYDWDKTGTDFIGQVGTHAAAWLGFITQPAVAGTRQPRMSARIPRGKSALREGSHTMTARPRPCQVSVPLIDVQSAGGKLATTQLTLFDR
jgi:hypothetical protein